MNETFLSPRFHFLVSSYHSWNSHVVDSTYFVSKKLSSRIFQKKKDEGKKRRNVHCHFKYPLKFVAKTNTPKIDSIWIVDSWKKASLVNGFECVFFCSSLLLVSLLPIDNGIVHQKFFALRLAFFHFRIRPSRIFHYIRAVPHWYAR